MVAERGVDHVQKERRGKGGRETEKIGGRIGRWERKTECLWKQKQSAESAGCGLS